MRDRVFQQIDQHLLNEHRVHWANQHFFRHMHLHRAIRKTLTMLCHGLRQNFLYDLRRLFDFCRAVPILPYARDRQKVLDHANEPLRIAVDLLVQFPLLLDG